MSSLTAARAWVDFVNKRDADALETLLAEDFTYSGMARTPPELGVRWGKEQFLAAVRRGGGSMRKPVIMSVVSEMEAGDRAVLETEGYGERPDGGVYANVYGLMFWTRGDQVTAVHDYCCTSTAKAHFDHINAYAKAEAGA